MADLQTVHDTVVNYSATANNSFGLEEPNSDDDPITPALSTVDFAKLYGEFIHYLASHGISANVPFIGMKSVKLWAELVMLVFASQTAGVS